MSEASQKSVAIALAEIAAAMMLLTRLPVPSTFACDPRISGRSLRYAPLVGVVVACGPAGVVGVGQAVRLPAPVIAVLALATAIVLTGALHEDGLADVADGFGGGRDRERRLAIMRDSRIGTYGALALGCSLVLRIACLAALLQRGVRPAIAALVMAAVLSRAAMLMPMALLPQARPDGLARSVGAVDLRSLLVAAVGASALAIAAALGGGWDVKALIATIAFCSACAFGITRLAQRMIGGVTGDVVGATQQGAEMAVLVALCIGTAAG